MRVKTQNRYLWNKFYKIIFVHCLQISKNECIDKKNVIKTRFVSVWEKNLKNDITYYVWRREICPFCSSLDPRLLQCVVTDVSLSTHWYGPFYTRVVFLIRNRTFRLPSSTRYGRRTSVVTGAKRKWPFRTAPDERRRQQRRLQMFF